MFKLAVFLMLLSAFHLVMVGFLFAEACYVEEPTPMPTVSRGAFYVVMHLIHAIGFAIGSFYILAQ